MPVPIETMVGREIEDHRVRTCSIDTGDEWCRHAVWKREHDGVSAARRNCGGIQRFEMQRIAQRLVERGKRLPVQLARACKRDAHMRMRMQQAQQLDPDVSARTDNAD